MEISGFSFRDYRLLVKKTYENRKESGGLSKNLENPTTASLKNECLHVLEKHWNNRDKSILKEFLNGQERNGQQEYIQCIRKIPSDNFKPVQKWITGSTETPTDRITELTALILNIQPRPFDINYDYELKHDEPETGPFSEVPPAKEDEKWGTALKKRRNIIAIIGVMVIVCGMLWIWFNYIAPFQDKTCMYWAGDHFEKIDCNQKIPNVMAIALDTFQLNHFKKINQIDTLTEDCIGKMWYSKVDNDIEFFTMGGMHPTHHQKALKPVSEYIFNKYIVKDL